MLANIAFNKLHHDNSATEFDSLGQHKTIESLHWCAASVVIGTLALVEQSNTDSDKRYWLDAVDHEHQPERSVTCSSPSSGWSQCIVT